MSSHAFPSHMYLVIRELSTPVPDTVVASTTHNEHKLQPVIVAVYTKLSGAMDRMATFREATALTRDVTPTPLQQEDWLGVLEGCAFIDPCGGEVKETVFVQRVMVGGQKADL